MTRSAYLSAQFSHPFFWAMLESATESSPDILCIDAEEAFAVYCMGGEL